MHTHTGLGCFSLVAVSAWCWSKQPGGCFDQRWLFQPAAVSARSSSTSIESRASGINRWRWAFELFVIRALPDLKAKVTNDVWSRDIQNKIRIRRPEWTNPPRPLASINFFSLAVAWLFQPGLAFSAWWLFQPGAVSTSLAVAVSTSLAVAVSAGGSFSRLVRQPRTWPS